MPTVTSADGTSIQYDRTGTGPTVILITAGPTDRNSNVELANLLSASCTVINYDRRGRGGSGDTPPYSVEREVEDLAALTDVAGEAALFGNSGGAFLAFRAAAAGLPVSKIAAWEPPYAGSASGHDVPADYAQQMRALADKGEPGEMVAHFLTRAVGMPAELVAGMRQAPFWPFLEGTANPGLIYDAELAGDFKVPTELLGTLDYPVMILDGGTTPWLTQAADAVAAAAAGTSARTTLDGQPHNVDAAVLAPALSDFFAAT